MSKDRSSKISKNVKHYRLMLVGVTPLLMSNDLPISLLTGTKPEISKDRSLKDICEANLYLDDDDNITMPAAKILAALSLVLMSVLNLRLPRMPTVSSDTSLSRS